MRNTISILHLKIDAILCRPCSYYGSTSVLFWYHVQTSSLVLVQLGYRSKLLV